MPAVLFPSLFPNPSAAAAPFSWAQPLASLCKMLKAPFLLLSRVPSFALLGVSCRELSEAVLQADDLLSLLLHLQKETGTHVVLAASVVVGPFLWPVIGE